MEKEYIIFKSFKPFLLCALGCPALLAAVITIYILYPDLKWLHYGLIVVGSASLILGAFKMDAELSKRKPNS